MKQTVIAIYFSLPLYWLFACPSCRTGCGLTCTLSLNMVWGALVRMNQESSGMELGPLVISGVLCDACPQPVWYDLCYLRLATTGAILSLNAPCILMKSGPTRLMSKATPWSISYL